MRELQGCECEGHAFLDAFDEIARKNTVSLEVRVRRALLCGKKSRSVGLVPELARTWSVAEMALT